MPSMKKTQSLLLLGGIVFSLFFVTAGGLLYLLKHGGHSLQSERLAASTYKLTVPTILQSASALTPAGIIELGLLTLVIMQFLRVMLLFLYYLKQRDYWFLTFSGFILFVLCYSLFFRS